MADEQVAPPVKRKNKPAVSRNQIEMAMHSTGGNRVEAAKLLGMTRAALSARIKINEELMARWSKKAMALREKITLQKLEAEGALSPAGVDIRSAQMDELAASQVATTKETVVRVNAIRLQIEQAEKARAMTAIPEDKRTEEEKAYIIKHGRDFDEMKLLFAQEVALLQEMRSAAESAATVSYRQAQIRQMHKKKGERDGHQRGLGIPPKGSAPQIPQNVTQFIDKAIINQPSLPPPELNGTRPNTDAQS